MKRLMTMCMLLTGCYGPSVFDAEPDAGSTDSTTQPVMSRVTIDPTTGYPDPDTQWSVSGSQVMLIGGWNIPLSMVAGSAVPLISASVRDNPETCSGCFDQISIVMQLISYEDGTPTQLAYTYSDASGHQQTISFAPMHTVKSTETLRLQFWTFTYAPTRMSTIGAIHIGTDSNSSSVTVRIPPSSFMQVAGALVSPLPEPDGTRLLYASLHARCSQTSSILFCIWSLDPMSSGSTNLLEVCAPSVACGVNSGIATMGIATSFSAGAHSVLELHVEGAGVVVTGADVETLISN